MEIKKKLLLGIAFFSLIFFSACSSNEPENMVEDREVLLRENAENSIEENQLENAGFNIPDGSYEESTSYNTPGGPENVVLRFEFTDGKLETLEVLKSDDVKQISRTRIDSFNSNVGDLIGKTIEEIQEVGIVGGSSLTTMAVKEKLADLGSRTV